MRYTSGYSYSSIGMNPHQTMWGDTPSYEYGVRPLASFPTCQKHNLILPDGICDACNAEIISKELRKREVEMNRYNPDPTVAKKETVEEMLVRTNPPMAPATWKVEARTKALELAIMSLGKDVHDTSNDFIVDTAQRFYTYITKGE